MSYGICFYIHYRHISLSNCRSKKHLQYGLFMLPMSQQYCTVICHNSTVPLYVTHMLRKKPSHSHKTRSSSHTMSLLNIPSHSKATLGNHSFFSSSLWNSFASDIRCAPSLSSSKSCLKRIFFSFSLQGPSFYHYAHVPALAML